MASPNFQPIRIRPLAAGLKSSRNPTLLEDGQSPRVKNVEFSSDSVLSSRGSVKLGNQALLRPSVRTRVDPAYSPLYVESDKSVPLRGYLHLGYDTDLDIGGDFAVSSGSFPSESFHNRRGRSFQRDFSVKIPETFRMFEPEARGAGAPAVGAGDSFIEANLGYDEGLDDCTLFGQKGGDGTAPMSWAVGIVNVGATTGGPASAKSRYRFVFMWLDSAEFGIGDHKRLRYDLTTPSASSTGEYSTQALRAIVFDVAVEVGRTYHCSLSLQLDSAAITAGSWNDDGSIALRVREEHGEVQTASYDQATTTFTLARVFKGPDDSAEYLVKYGIRFSGRDAEHWGLGYRGAPWNAQGFIPFGMDSAAMEHKGFRMPDCSNNTEDELYGPGNYTLECTHPTAAAFLRINTNRGLRDGNANFNQSPLGPTGSAWAGWGDGIAAVPDATFNAQSLRGYRMVFPSGVSTDGGTNMAGAVVDILSYTEFGVGDLRIDANADTMDDMTGVARPWLLRAFRWNQQEIVLGELRAWSAPRDFTSERVLHDLGRSIELDDLTETDLSTLLAVWPLNDGEGGACRELVRRKDAFFAPFALGAADGTEGRKAVFLSGEGEAIVLDLSEDPVFQREFRYVLEGGKTGFAIEISFQLTEAHYGVDVDDPTRPTGRRLEASHCPDIARWSLKPEDDSGLNEAPSPLLVFGHHTYWDLFASTLPIRRPQGFHLDVAVGSDQEQNAIETAVSGRSDPGNNWDDAAPWVGKRLTMQFGVQPSADNRAGVAGAEREFDVYLAATPKESLAFVEGDTPGAEIAFFTSKTIQARDLARAIITIGGGWDPSVRGYLEYSCRMIVDKMRVYGATAPGALPALAGDAVPTGTGKLVNANALPQRELTFDEILQRIGNATSSLILTEGSRQHSAPGNTTLYTDDPEDSIRAVRERYLRIEGDTHAMPDLDGIVKLLDDYYYIESSTPSALTTVTPFMGGGAAGVAARSFALVGYTSFSNPADDPRRLALTLGSRAAFKPGTSTTGDLSIVEDLWVNAAPTNVHWRLRVASPFTEGSLAAVRPAWVRGIVPPRRNPITGIATLDDTVFASTRGAIYRVDDRWREDGPTPSLRSSLDFLPQDVEGQRFPRAFDMVVFPTSWENAWPYWTGGLHNGQTWVFDFWVKARSYRGIQTLGWLGYTRSTLMEGPGTTDAGRGTGWWARLNQGRVEWVMESAGTYDGSNSPEDGEYVATSSDRIPLDEWVHVRIYQTHRATGSEAFTPGLFINGRNAGVRVNARENGTLATVGWVFVGGSAGGGIKPTSGDPGNLLVLGAARDALRAPRGSGPTAINELGGQELIGGRLVGFMHPLDGQIAQAVVWRMVSTDPSVFDGVGFPNFDPYEYDYTGLFVRFRAELEEGVGYKVGVTENESQGAAFEGVPGLILSHPGIDLWDEFGRSDRPASMATYQQRVYFANGGRPVFVEQDRASPAGVLPPNTKPRHELVRRPLWKPNFRVAGVADPDHDPIGAAAIGATPILHYATWGNAFLRQAFHEEMAWGRDAEGSPPTFDVFGLKFLGKPRSVAGRQVLWSARGDVNSGGPYLECVDGKVRVGWYDTFLKKSVYVESTSPIFRAGYWYYIYLRKAYPMQDPVEGNWLNSFPTLQGAAIPQGRRIRASYTGLAGGPFTRGERIQNGGATRKGIVYKQIELTATTGILEYLLDTGSDFTSEVVTGDDSGASATIDVSSGHRETVGDALVIREFARTAPVLDNPPWSFQDGAKGSGGGNTRRLSVSFTSDGLRPPGTTATGPVSIAGLRYNGTGAGIVSVDTTYFNTGPFRRDHIGMYWQWDAAVDPKVYRIVAWVLASQVLVVDETGTAPDWTVVPISSESGGVFIGANLKRSEDFDASTTPDATGYDTEFMGTRQALDPSNGIAPTDWEFASFGWLMRQTIDNVNDFYNFLDVVPAPDTVLFFEQDRPSTTDANDYGTDDFPALNYSATAPGPLHFDWDAIGALGASQFTVVDGVDYAETEAVVSTQPSSLLEVPIDDKAEVKGSPNAASLFWGHVVPIAQALGRRKIGVIFYDPEQDARSNPGPLLTIEPGGDDGSNPSGRVDVLLTDLPISPQPGRIQRWIYASEVNGRLLFRQVILEDNVSVSVSFPLDEARLELNVTLDYDNSAPPDCAIVGTSQGAMFYGDAIVRGVRARDVLYFSKPYFPGNVPRRNVLPLIGGHGEPIKAMVDLKGRLLVFKDGAFVQVVLRDGIAIQVEGSKRVGAAGPQAAQELDDRVYWLSNDRGLYVYSGAGGGHWLGEKVSDVFAGQNAELGVDTRRLLFASTVLSRANDQIIVAYKAANDLDQRRRLSVEFDSEMSGATFADMLNGHRYSAYDGPNLTALGSVQRELGGPERLLGGTAEGFLVWLDRLDTQVHLALQDPVLAYPTSLLLGAGSTTTRLVLAATNVRLAELDGPRGATVRWLDGSGVEQRASVLASDGSVLLLDRPATAPPPDGSTVSLGAIEHVWTSKWFDLGLPELRKTSYYVDLVLTPQASGTAIFEAFCDFETTPVQLRINGALVTQDTIDLTQSTHRVPVGLRGRHFQFRIRTAAPTAGQRLEIITMVIRGQETEGH